jgi:recombination protein U
LTRLHVSQANRGMAFEKLVDMSNRQYRDREIAQIGKVPTPVKVLKLVKGRIKDGFFNKKEKEFVDYVGSFKGRMVAFDAKSTKVKTRFDLKNVHEHQVMYLLRATESGAVAFFLFNFAALHRTFIMPIEYFMPYWMAMKHKTDGIKSIPLHAFEGTAIEVGHSYRAPIDYLEAVQKNWNFEEGVTCRR